MSAEAMKKSCAILGKAVHPDAHRRLHQLWPDAVVRVNHVFTGNDDVPAGHRPPPKWTTIVRIYERPGVPGGPISGQARCAPEDYFDRRLGVALAFNRALKNVSALAKRRYVHKGMKIPPGAVIS